MNKAEKIAIITAPIGKAGTIPLKNIANIAAQLSGKKAYGITGGDGANELGQFSSIDIIDISPPKWVVSNYILWTLIFQYKILISIIILRKECDQFILFIGGELLFAPAILLKILKKETILIMAGSLVHSNKAFGRIPGIFFTISSKIVCKVSNKIVVYSNRISTEYGLNNYISKIQIASEHIVDNSKFSIRVPFKERRKTIGYIGRMSEEKGICDFIKALPLITDDSIEILIIGKGALLAKSENYLKKNKIKINVKFIDWIPHNEVPDHLNKMKLLIIPSKTEGLPNIMLESMSCGTPILATEVGAIPDIIKNNYNGFLIKDTSPLNLAETIIRIVNSIDLENVSSNSRQYVIDNFEEEIVIKKWQEILSFNN
jgi:glycosyltransferase involved in cell wall biosynthesis